MFGVFLAAVAGGLLMWFAWRRATGDVMKDRIPQISATRGLFGDVDRAVVRLRQSSEGTRKEWFLAAGSIGSSREGPVAREAKLLEDAARQAASIERQVDLTPRDIGQLAPIDLAAVTANLRVLLDVARSHQMAVDASRLRLESFTRAKSMAGEMSQDASSSPARA
jgi:hypothetical protein